MTFHAKRKLFSEYLRKDRIKAKAIESEVFTIIKECLDNAADEAENNKSNYVEISYLDYIFSVKNRGEIPKESLKIITSFEELWSTKYSLRKLTRGLVGHGLKFAIMLSFQEDDDTTKKTFLLHTGGVKYSIRLKNRYSKDPYGVLEVVKEKSEIEKDKTMIEVDLRHFYNPTTDFEKFVYPFILGNPHITFLLKDKNGEKIYARTIKENIEKKTDISAYTLEEFKEFLKENELLEENEIRKNISKIKIKKLLHEFNVRASVSAKFENLQDLYDFIQKNSKKIKIPRFGKKAIGERMKDFLEDFSLLDYGYGEEKTRKISFEVVMFSTSNSALNRITVVHNGTYYPKHNYSFGDYKSKQALINKLEEKGLKMMVISWSTKSVVSGNNKDFIHLPMEILTLMEDIFKKTVIKKEKGKNKNYYEWMPKYKEYKDLIETDKYTNVKNLLDRPINEIEKGDKKLIKILFLNDCMTVIRELVDEFKRISVRTAYYQLLSHGYITIGSYGNFDKVLAEGREEGYVPWDIFIDESKPYDPAYEGISIDTNVKEYIKDEIESALIAPSTFNEWEKQNMKVEVWIEKEALKPIIRPIIDKYKVAVQTLRGYPSITKAKEGVERIKSYLEKKLEVKILYLGDFDPSGWNITKVLQEKYFYKEIKDKRFELRRLGLNFEQLKDIVLDPLPFSKNEKKLKEFEKEFKHRFEEAGYEWGKYEIEAMNPKQIQNILEDSLKSCMKDKIDEEAIKKWYEEFEEIKKKIIENLKNVFEENDKNTETAEE